MKDWNVVITVNDSESFRKARREFQRFGDVESTDYRNVWFSVCPMSRSLFSPVCREFRLRCRHG